MKNRPLVIYHDNCADGFGAAFVAWLTLGDTADYMPASYTDEVNAPDWIDLVDGRDVFVLDFSYPKAVMELTLLYANSLVWLDHHKSAFELWCGKYDRGMKAMQFEYTANGQARPIACHIELDDTRSGALIAWNYFHPQATVPPLISHVDDYDRWQFKISGTKEINAAVWSYAPWSFEQWRVWVNDWELAYGHEMLAEGSAILRAHMRKVADVVDYCARPVRVVPPLLLALAPWTPPWSFGPDDTVGAVGLAANCPPDLANDVGHALARMSGAFGLTWHQGKGDKIKCSVRGNGTCDVSKIAKEFGGGGHENAAGFSTTIEQLQSWLINNEGDDK